MLSPSVSIRATSTPSWDVPLIRPIAVAGCTGPLRFPSDPRPVTPRPPNYATAAQGAIERRLRGDRTRALRTRALRTRALASEHLQVRVPAYSGEPGIHSPDLRARGARRARARRQDHGVYWVRLHCPLAAHWLAAADHDALLDAADRSEEHTSELQSLRHIS